MANFTPFLGLLQENNPEAYFNVDAMLNENWGKVDAVFDADPNAANTPSKSFVPMCKIGTYTGSGGHGSGHPCAIENVGFVPDFIFVSDWPVGMNYDVLRLFRPFCTESWGVTWGEDSVSWYYTGSQQAADMMQHNEQGITYYYIIIGHKEAIS